MLPTIGKILVVLGVLSVLAGVLLWKAHFSIPWLGRLPGDILIKKENFSFYFPVVSCLLVSGVLTILWYLFRR